MFTSRETVRFRASLLAWFDLHKRDLPWRRTRDPYAIWVSEIMLQQTRVAAVLEHYAEWMRQFPTIEALASASEDKVLAAWSGLGYYRRARFLHRGAQVVRGEHGGKLPGTAAELLKLPGIGAYTSAAIASIAFGEPAAVVDGNVERVLLRQTGNAEAGAKELPGLRGLSPADVQALAGKLLDPRRPGDFNQAIMELGATVCLPRNPLCLQCPVQASCRTRGEHPTAARKAIVNAEIVCGFLRRQGDDGTEILLEQRSASETVMPGMWELPRFLPDIHAEMSDSAKPLLVVRHAIMHTSYRVSVMEVNTGEDSSSKTGEAGHFWFAARDIGALPLTGLARKVLLRLGILERRMESLEIGNPLAPMMNLSD